MGDNKGIYNTNYDEYEQMWNCGTNGGQDMCHRLSNKPSP
jgi:hypothetical protein